MYIDNNDSLVQDQAASLVLTCPHCLVQSHLTPQAIPKFSELSAARPKQIGLVYRCDACNEPVFLRYAVRSYSPTRVELSAHFAEVERPREPFNFSHVPEEIEALFQEALLCYSHGILNAFASMCRRTMQAVFSDLGESGKLRIFDELNTVRDMAEIDPASFSLIKRVIFGTDADPAPAVPVVDDDQSGVLLEVVKDLLYQAYVRRGRLQQAMVVRRFFSDQSDTQLHRFDGVDAAAHR